MENSIFSYTKGWNTNITREERFFTCVLYNDLQKSRQRARAFISDNITSNKKDGIASLINTPGEFEIGYEVCLYRDFIHFLKQKELRVINSDNYPLKRTFDFSIFTRAGLLIIEAKAQQGYSKEQLESIKKDKIKLAGLLEISESMIKIISLHSSKYRPKQSTLKCFDGYLTWDMVAKQYKENQAIYVRANEIYRK